MMQRHLSRFTALGCLISALPLYASAATVEVASEGGKSTSISGKTFLGTAAVEDSYNRTRAVGARFDLDARHRFMEELQGFVSLSAAAETGSSLYLFSDEYKPKKSIGLNEAYLQWAPIQGLNLQAGALNQYDRAPLLFGYATFAGAAQSYEYRYEKVSFRVSAEQAIPSTDSTLTNTTEAEAVPFFHHEKLTVTADATPDLQIGGRVGYYSFNSLPGSVAQDSRFRGNTIVGAAPGASFRYDFHGIEGGTDIDWRLGRFTPGAGAYALRNLSAPAGMNQGYLFELRTAWSYNPSIVLTPMVSVFRNESDTAPGSYNSGYYGHNNRKGGRAGLRADFKKADLRIEGFATRAAVIESTPFQSDFTSIQFSLRKTYDLL